MTEHETIMYLIMGALFKSDAPLVFKGALVIKAILDENGFDGMDRETVDIDSNWVNEAPTMEYLLKTINRSLHGLNKDFQAIELRKYTDTQSARVGIMNGNLNVPGINLDIKIKPVNHYKTYFFGEVSFNGVIVSEILADKISILSSDKIFRRVKDLVDIYALSHCIPIQIEDILETCEREGRVISSFEAFLNRKDDLEHAYNKLQRIQGKPPFNVVYSYMENFLRPFVKQAQDDMIWNSQDCIWEEVDRCAKMRSIDH